jgi:hypothetical protein
LAGVFLTRYRKKPVEVEAWFFEGEASLTDAPDWVAENVVYQRHHGTLLVDWVEVVPGEWIVRDEHGDVFPYDPLRFWEAYEVIA